MKRLAATIIAASAFITAANAQDHAVQQDHFTVEQCLTILSGLNSLNYVGQQFGSTAPPPADAKQYKLGPLRMTIGLDIAALNPLQVGAQHAQQGFIAELPPLPAPEADKPASQDLQDARVQQNKKIQANALALMQAPCNVQLGHLSATALKIGDDPTTANQFPPTVLGAIMPIVDQ